MLVIRAGVRGAYILGTDDDDVSVDRGWLQEYVRALQTLPAAAVFGGPVRPRFEDSRPLWLVAAWPQVQRAYGIRDHGDAMVRLEPPARLPFGSNYAVRASKAWGPLAGGPLSGRATVSKE